METEQIAALDEKLRARTAESDQLESVTLFAQRILLEFPSSVYTIEYDEVHGYSAVIRNKAAT